MMILIVYNNYWLIYFFILRLNILDIYPPLITIFEWLCGRPTHLCFCLWRIWRCSHIWWYPKTIAFPVFQKRHIKVVAPISEKQFWGKIWITILKPLVPNITWGSSNFGSSPVFGCTLLRSEVHVATESVEDFAVELQNGCAGAVEHGGTWWNLGLGLVTTGIIWVKMFKLSHCITIWLFNIAMENPS
jgi:hypothetical protein